MTDTHADTLEGEQIRRESFIRRIGYAIAVGRAKIGRSITKEEATARAKLVADALPGLFTS